MDFGKLLKNQISKLLHGAVFTVPYIWFARIKAREKKPQNGSYHILIISFGYE